MEKEIFKDIKGFEGYYQVSNLGRVKSLERKTRHWRGGYRNIKSRILKNAITNKGYVYINLYKNNKKNIYTVHTLVAIAFLHHKPCGHKLVVDHKNGIKSDNRLENLRIITQRENTRRKYKNKSSKYIGVYYHKKSQTYYARISINGKSIGLGGYDKEIDAHKAYQKALENHRKNNNI